MAMLSTPVFAHFGMVIPSDSMPKEIHTLNLTLSFPYPFEGNGMDLERPERFAVSYRDQKVDLTKLVKKSLTDSRPMDSIGD